jgi:hypothetical protein
MKQNHIAFKANCSIKSINSNVGNNSKFGIVELANQISSLIHFLNRDEL